MCLFTLELLENTASDNNVSTVFIFKYSRTEKIRFMAGVSDIRVYTFGYLQVRSNFSHSCLPSIMTYC